VFPPGLVDEVVAEVGRTEQRHRSLPARVMAYFSIGMALYSEGSYDDVLAQLTDGLAWASGWQESYSPSSKSAQGYLVDRTKMTAHVRAAAPSRGALSAFSG